MPKGNPSKDTADKLNKEIKALEYRRAGYTYDQIAKALQFKAGTTARTYVQKAMQRAVQEGTDELREIEAHRLDTAQAAIWQNVINGDVTAVNALIRIMERRSKLLGLDAPVRAEVDVTHFDGGTEIDNEVKALAEFINNHAKNVGAGGPVVLGSTASKNGAVAAKPE